MKFDPKLLAAAAALAMACGAQAGTADLSAGPFQISVDKYNTTPFTDIYDFTLGSFGSGTVSSSAIEVKLGKFVDIAWDATKAFTVYAGPNGTGAVLASFGDPGVSTGSFSIEDLAIAGNTFSVVIKGTAVGNGLSTFQPGLRGHYDLNVIAQPVPEPGAIAMMLAGLGGLGFVRRGRKTAVA